ncbi:MAG: hypothetical protein K0R51_2899 [Cytophagaceae bacterium]|jgi:hypothetical protein|nr:hypothetical protein [Cytophagaceae bacterium]
MAGIKLLSVRLKASSLIETIVAMMIVMLVFFVAMSIYVNVLRNGITLSEISAAQQLQVLAEETVKNKSYFNENLVLETLTITKNCASYNSSTELFLLDLEAKDKSGRTVATRKELILKSSNE